jgi:TatD DNase family protein
VRALAVEVTWYIGRMGYVGPFGSGIVDTHCHLDAADFLYDLSEVLVRARAEGVRWFVTIGSGRGTESAPDAIALARTHPDVVACVGIHPLDASCATPQVLETLSSFASDRRVVGIGETGLDYRLAYTQRSVQRNAFRRQVQLARATRKPLVIHTRAAAADTLAILREEGGSSVGGVLHSFSGDSEFAFAALDLGFDISFSALPLLDDAPRLLSVARSIPIDRLMIESNAPVCAPPPHRGRRCEPAHLPLIASALASTMNLDAAELCARTCENAVRRFGLAQMT